MHRGQNCEIYINVTACKYEHLNKMTRQNFEQEPVN